MSSSARYWRVTDAKPDPIPEFSSLVATSIEHELDLDTLEYTWTAHFSNSDPWAESSTSLATRNFEVQRLDEGWWMRLLGRNHSMFDTPHAWEPAPPGFCDEWDAALAARQRSR